MHGGLNDNQVRRVVVALSHVEQALDATESLLEGPRQGLFREISIGESAQGRQEVGSACRAARELLREAAARFNLPARREDGARIARAECMAAWSGVEEIRATRLAGYGQVDPVLRDTLDPIVDDLSRLLLRLGTLFDRWPAPD